MSARAFSTVGQAVPRVDAEEKTSGRAKYTTDLALPGMAYAKLALSPLPHARIVSIDASRARALPGVYAVLTAAELTGMETHYGSDRKDRPIVAMGKVRFEGEPIAAVAAVDLAKAEEAVELIEAEYEELPPVIGLEAALAGESEPVQETNVCHRYEVAWGDAAGAMAACDHVFEDTFTFPMVYHYAMEPHAVIADYQADRLSVWSSAQHPFLVRAELARVFRKRLDQVRVVVPYVGGGYGSKSYTKIEPLAAALSRLAGRPVRLALSVEEAMKTVRRHATRATIRTGVQADGTFVARECRVELDTGAYTDNGVRVTERAADRLPGPYRFEHLRSEAVGLFTNTTPAGSFRSIGGPQGAWACESHTDNIAHALGIDPLELRLKNLVRPGEELLRGRRRLEADLAAPLAEVARGFGWHDYEPVSTAPHLKRGVGMACAVANAGASPISGAFVRLHADGSATVHVGTTEIGQGSRSALAQIAAEELRLPLSSVRVIASDTDAVPYDRSTGASRSTTLAGLAVHDAAADARAQMEDAAARYFETFAEQVALAEGSASFEGESISYGALIGQVFGGAGGEIVGRSAITPDHPSGKLAEDPVFWEVSMGFAEVEVDTETGRVRVLRYTSVADPGKAINPAQVEGQDEGAAMQGVGHTLFEEMRYEEGQLMNPNLIDYRVPTFGDLPDEFHTVLLERGDGPGPYGAKGVGEGGIVAVAPAVANALFNATGARIRDLPLTPERVWRALRETNDA
ncbi:MAG: xanthine dehydrogenase family protein molybdopterin-binding subunit [Chloroflexota bacterium]|nr:xanthine dehydrogenase family protein molybdopterin-binding subunit [Chloroflexota bacterium]